MAVLTRGIHVSRNSKASGESKEAVVAKDADILDQLLLLREYKWQGNREAAIWLGGKSHERPYAYLEKLKTESALALGKAVYNEPPSSWWSKLYTNQRRQP